MNPTVKKIYDEVYKLFPPDTGKKGLEYVRRTWIFPHHIDVMLGLAEELCEKYSADLETCQLAIILHDTGLEYGRTEATPKGHEERSLEYAEDILKRYEYASDQISRILDCIRATEPDYEPEAVEEEVVRTCDAMSQFITVHFWAKAAFSGDWDWYVEWMDGKVKKNFKKICFEDEQEKIEPIRKYMLEAIERYKKNRKT